MSSVSPAIRVCCFVTSTVVAASRVYIVKGIFLEGLTEGKLTGQIQVRRYSLTTPLGDLPKAGPDPLDESLTDTWTRASAAADLRFCGFFWEDVMVWARAMSRTNDFFGQQ